MRGLSFFLVTACLVFGLGQARTDAQAQAAKATSGKVASAWKCSAPNPVHAIPVGDAPDHVYVVQQTKCTATKGEVAGVAEKEGTATEVVDVRGNTASGHGTFVETLANGDKVHVSYEFKGTSKDKNFESGTNKWTYVSGTGLMKGAKGGGTCTAKGNADGSANFECAGTYSLAK